MLGLDKEVIALAQQPVPLRTTDHSLLTTPARRGVTELAFGSSPAHGERCFTAGGLPRLENWQV
jgi:hypothetical protein